MHNHKGRFDWISFSLALCALLSWASTLRAQTTSFTYQGVMNDGGVPANTNYDMQFKLFDTINGGAQVGTTITNPTVMVTNGVFTVQLDFGSGAFTGAARFLEMGVRPAGNTGAYAVSPRTQITSTPYAIRALNSSQLNGVDATRIIQTDNNGNVGVGTISPTSKLDVRGNVTLEAGASPVLYTGTANTDQNRYLQLINSPTAPSASGLKAGGLLVADSFSFANPGKNDLIVKGNTGMGTATPRHRLSIAGGPAWTSAIWAGAVELTNASAIGWQTNAAGNRFGIGHTGGGLFFFRTAADPGSTAGAPNYDMLIADSGNVGIGSIAPESKLHLSGSASLLRPFRGLTIDQNLNSAGADFSGYSFQVRSTLNNVTTTDFIINSAGNVGIGTATPTTARLVVNDTSNGTGVAAFSSAGSGVVGLSSVAAAGVYGESTSAKGQGVYGRNNAGGYAVFADGAVYAAGNAAQTRDKGGFVKAMALVKDDGQVILCYNSQASGAEVNTPPCKIKVTYENDGSYLVDFGFPVSDRFISLTPRTLTDSKTAPIDVTAAVTGAITGNVNQTQAWFRSPTSGARSGFFIFVY